MYTTLATNTVQISGVRMKHKTSGPHHELSRGISPTGSMDYMCQKENSIMAAPAIFEMLSQVGNRRNEVIFTGT